MPPINVGPPDASESESDIPPSQRFEEVVVPLEALPPRVVAMARQIASQNKGAIITVLNTEVAMIEVGPHQFRLAYTATGPAHASFELFKSEEAAREVAAQVLETRELVRSFSRQ